MADSSQVAEFKKGSNSWNAWRVSCEIRRPDLRNLEFLSAVNEIHKSYYPPPVEGYDFTGSDLHGASFRNCMFIKCRFDGSDMNFADLVDSHFQSCSFDHVSMRVSTLGSGKFRQCSFHDADLSYCSAEKSAFFFCDFTGTALEHMSLVKTVFDESVLKDSRVYGISAWDLSLSQTKQQDIIITPEDEATISVDSIELAQFIYLLLNNRGLRGVIETLTSKVVLILGRFSERRKAVLDSIKAVLRADDLIPIVFDFEQPSSRDVRETVSLLGHMSRIVIADISDPRSVPAELESLVPHLPSVRFQIIIDIDQKPYGLSEHVFAYQHVLPKIEYRLDNLSPVLEKLRVVARETDSHREE